MSCPVDTSPWPIWQFHSWQQVSALAFDIPSYASIWFPHGYTWPAQMRTKPQTGGIGIWWPHGTLPEKWPTKGPDGTKQSHSSLHSKTVRRWKRRQFLRDKGGIRTWKLLEQEVKKGIKKPVTILLLFCCYYFYRITCISVCSQSPYAAEDDFESLILLPPSPRCWDYRHMLSRPVLCWPRNWTFWMLAQRSSNWTKCPAPTPLLQTASLLTCSICHFSGQTLVCTR